MARKPTAPRVVVAHTRADGAMAGMLAAALGATTDRIVDDAGSSGGETLVLLVTPRLLASEWLWSDELAAWIARHRAGEAHVVPVLGRRAATAGTPLAGLPVAGSVALDAWDDLAEAAKAAADEIHALLAAPPSADAPPDAPVPAWPDDATRRIGERLSALYAWRAAEPGPDVDAAIAAARGMLRRGPVLRAGEFLGDGRWRLLSPIGHNATDTLWKAYDRSTGSTAAVKVFHGPWTADEEAATRFLYGARRLAGLEHPGVAHTLDCGNDEGFVWVAVEHPEGGTLRDAVLGGKLRGSAALQAVVEVGRALEHAHARAFLHGQVNPTHIRFAADGSAQLVDFALARDPADGGKATVFDPPEALEPTWHADPVGDGYSLAMTALFALHGADLPFWVLRDPGRLIDALPVVDPVRRVLRRATGWDRDSRFQSVAGFLQALLDDAAVVRALADSAHQQGRLAVAAEHYEALLAASAPSDADLGEDVELQTILGEIYLKMERPDDASGHLVAALGIATEVEPLFPLLRAVGERTGDWERVAGALEAEWAGRGPSDRALLASELAHVYQERLGDRARASKAWSRVLDDHRRPEDALRALRALADIARASDDWDAFIAWSRDLLGYLPAEERPPVQHAIGETFLVHKNDEQNGLLWIDRAASGGYRPMSIAKTLEEIRARRGEWPQAIALMRAQAADQTAAQAVRTLLRAAHIARSVNLEAEAAAIWATLLERVPDHHLALRNLARMQFRAGHHTEALPLYEKLCAVVHGKPAEQPESSERANDNVSCARLLLQAGREEEALARLEEALRLEPRHAPALHFAAPLHLARGDAARARTVYERLLWTFRTEDRLDAQTEACLGLGEIEWIEGKLADAAAWYLRAVEFDSGSAAGWWGLARVALAARGGHPGAERAPWLRAAPSQFTPHEALARLLMGVLDASAARKWLDGDPMGRAVLAGGDSAARVTCAVVDLLVRRRLVGPALFARLAAVAGWERQVEAVRHLWLEPADTDDSFPVHTSYAWARRVLKDDFDPQGARPVLQVAPPAGGDADRARFDVLLAGKPPAAPGHAAVPPEPPGKEHAAVAAPIVALVETPWLRLALGRDADAAVIGSGPECHCMLSREGVAPEHALLFRAGANVYIRSLGGETVVDGEPVEARRLVGGEDLVLGPVRLRVRFVASTDQLPAPEAQPQPQPQPEPQPEPEAAPAKEAEPAPPEPVVQAPPEPPPVPERTDDLPVEPTAVEPTPAWAVEEEEVTIPSLVAPPPITVPPPRGPTPLPAPMREAPPPAVVARIPTAKPAPTPAPAPRVAAPPRRSGVLQGLSGPAKGLEGRIEEMLTVGRGKACGLRIGGDNKLSTEHFRIERRDEGWILVDTDSSNGTVVNGSRVKEIALAGGETIMAGKSVLLFKVVDARA